MLAAAPVFLSSRAERPFSPGELLRRELIALSTSSSDGSAPELMTVPGRGRVMSTLVTSATDAALVVRIEGGEKFLDKAHDSADPCRRKPWLNKHFFLLSMKPSIE